MQPGIVETEWPSRVWGRIVCTAGIFAIATILADRSTVCVSALAPLCVTTARSISQILTWLGMDSQREMAILVHPAGFGYEIGFNCTGIIPAGLLATAILASAGNLRIRVWGAVIGVISVLMLNVVRLVSLFYIGVLAPGFFVIAHTVVWQGLTVLSVAGFFYAWRRWFLSSGQRPRWIAHPTVCNLEE